MNLDVVWHKPLNLVDGSENHLIFDVNGIAGYDGMSGVYVFGRKYRNKLYPLYIGKASKIGARIRQHLNTTKLMKQIQDSGPGERVVVIGEFKPKSGQKTGTAITLIETALIRQALSMGYQLLNKSGTKIPVHDITFSGNLEAKRFSGNKIGLEYT